MRDARQLFNCMEQIVETNEKQWNNPLGHIDYELEANMLQEELNEFKEAVGEVDRLDAIDDLWYVLVGTLHKMGLRPDLMVDSLQVVIDANKQKNGTKDINGKVSKDKDSFINPEPLLQDILDKRKPFYGGSK